MPVLVRASCESFKARVEERRQVLENARNANLRRLRADIDRIAKREQEFLKKTLDVIVPVKLSWDEKAWDRVKDFIPIRVEVNEGNVPADVPPSKPETPDL